MQTDNRQAQLGNATSRKYTRIPPTLKRGENPSPSLLPIGRVCPPSFAPTPSRGRSLGASETIAYASVDPQAKLLLKSPYLLARRIHPPIPHQPCPQHPMRPCSLVCRISRPNCLSAAYYRGPVGHLQDIKQKSTGGDAGIRACTGDSSHLLF